MEDAKMDEITHYETLRKKNIEDNKIVLAKLMSDISDQMVKAPVKPVPTKKQKRKVYQPDFIRRNPSRYARVAPSRFDLPYARPRHRSGSVSSTASSSTTASSISSPASSPEKMVVRFGFFKKTNAGISQPDFDDEFDQEYSDDDTPLPGNTRIQKKRAAPAVKPVEEITEADLNMIATAVIDKKYDSIYGTCCHQCRQKTIDMKTICRSEKCYGVRGQFCGVCLRNRYGEDAKAALLDKNWICPPCRGICNCSFCRKKNNKSATGILIHCAREKGFHDVNSYLQSLKHKE